MKLGDTIVGANSYILGGKIASLKAIGMYVKLASLPNNFDISEEKIVSMCKDGRTTVKSALKELENLGLLHRFQRKRKDGKFGESIYFISCMPMTEDEKLDVENKIE